MLHLVQSRPTPFLALYSSTIVRNFAATSSQAPAARSTSKKQSVRGRWASKSSSTTAVPCCCWPLDCCGGRLDFAGILVRRGMLSVESGCLSPRDSSCLDHHPWVLPPRQAGHQRTLGKLIHTYLVGALLVGRRLAGSTLICFSLACIYDSSGSTVIQTRFSRWRWPLVVGRESLIIGLEIKQPNRLGYRISAGPGLDVASQNAIVTNEKNMEPFEFTSDGPNTRRQRETISNRPARPDHDILDPPRFPSRRMCTQVHHHLQGVRLQKDLLMDQMPAATAVTSKGMRYSTRTVRRRASVRTGSNTTKRGVRTDIVSIGKSSVVSNLLSFLVYRFDVDVMLMSVGGCIGTDGLTNCPRSVDILTFSGRLGDSR